MPKRHREPYTSSRSTRARHYINGSRNYFNQQIVTKEAAVPRRVRKAKPVVSMPKNVVRRRRTIRRTTRKRTVSSGARSGSQKVKRIPRRRTVSRRSYKGSGRRGKGSTKLNPSSCFRTEGTNRFQSQNDLTYGNCLLKVQGGGSQSYNPELNSGNATFANGNKLYASLNQIQTKVGMRNHVAYCLLGDYWTAENMFASSGQSISNFDGTNTAVKDYRVKCEVYNPHEFPVTMELFWVKSKVSQSIAGNNDAVRQYASNPYAAWFYGMQRQQGSYEFAYEEFNPTAFHTPGGPLVVFSG